jgi:hypothetical protein
MDSSIDRLDKYLKSKEINDNQFTVKTKIAQGWIGKARERKSSITEKTYIKIFKAFPDLNESWIKTGEGDMIKSKERQESPSVAKLLKENEEIKKSLIEANNRISEMGKEMNDLQKKLIEVLLNPKKK